MVFVIVSVFFSVMAARIVGLSVAVLLFGLQSVGEQLHSHVVLLVLPISGFVAIGPVCLVQFPPSCSPFNLSFYHCVISMLFAL